MRVSKVFVCSSRSVWRPNWCGLEVLNDAGFCKYRNRNSVESCVYEKSILARVCRMCEVFEEKCGACQGDGPRWCMYRLRSLVIGLGSRPQLHEHPSSTSSKPHFAILRFGLCPHSRSCTRHQESCDISIDVRNDTFDAYIRTSWRAGSGRRPTARSKSRLSALPPQACM